jgi:BASS family bile acid:Na+ symporter
MEQSALIEIGLPIALIIIMAGMGMTLTPADFRKVTTRPKGLVWGSVAQLFILPMIGMVVAALLRLPPEIAVGLVIIAACPGGTTSNLVTYLARGNLALSIALTVIASLATIVTLPVFVNFALDRFIEADARVHLPVLRTIAMLVTIILIPVAVGMSVRRIAPGFAARFERFVSIFGAVVLLALIIGISISVSDQLGAILSSAGPAVISLNICGIALGLLGTRLFGLPADQAITVAVEVGIKNATLGMLIAITMMNSPEMAVPSALYGMLMYAFGAGLIVYGRRNIAAPTL